MAASFSGGHCGALASSFLASLQPALPLDLGDMQGRYLQASMLQYIRFDLVIDDFALRRSQIQLISIQLHLDMLLSI